MRMYIKVINDHRSEFPIGIEIKKPEKIQGFNGIRTRDHTGSNPVLSPDCCFRLLYSSCLKELPHGKRYLELKKTGNFKFVGRNRS